MMNSSNWDNMLADTGYAISESELPRLAHQIELLESLVEGGASEICDFVPDMVNPSDATQWIESLIELTRGSSSITTMEEASPDAGEQQVLFQEDQSSPLFTSISKESASSGNNKESSVVASNLPVMVHMLEDEARDQVGGEEEESGLRIIQLLLAGAACVEQQEELARVEDIVTEIRMLVISMGNRAGVMGRLAMHFAQGLARRIIYARSTWDNKDKELEDPTYLEMLHFYHTCPYLKFGHFTANQAMLEEFEGEAVVHIIEIELGLGLQWPPLIQMLAIRPGGPPSIRLTAIVADDEQVRLQAEHTAMRLVKLATAVRVELQYQLVEDIQSVQVRSGEALAVNSMLQLHKFLKDDSLNAILTTVRSLGPKIFTVVEQDANHNCENLQNRFFEALHFYSSMFDSIDACCKQQQHHHHHHHEAAVSSEAYLGREIGNIIACEGKARVERHERLEQWKQRMYTIGFRPRHLGFNAYNQAATLLTIFPGGGHTIQETAGCLTLGWQSRSLFAASAWRSERL